MGQLVTQAFPSSVMSIRPGQFCINSKTGFIYSFEVKIESLFRF